MASARGMTLLLSVVSMWVVAPAWSEEASPAAPPVPESSEAFPVDPAAQDPTGAQKSWADRFQRALDNEWYKVSIDMRARIGLADFDGLRNSYAYTLRSRLGVGSKPWHGLSAFVEGEGTDRKSVV